MRCENCGHPIYKWENREEYAHCYTQDNRYPCKGEFGDKQCGCMNPQPKNEVEPK